MEIIYITEGVNFKFDRAAYKTAEAAFADLQVDYPVALMLKFLQRFGLTLGTC